MRDLDTSGETLSQHLYRIFHKLFRHLAARATEAADVVDAAAEAAGVVDAAAEQLGEQEEVADAGARTLATRKTRTSASASAIPDTTQPSWCVTPSSRLLAKYPSWQSSRSCP